MDVCVCVQVGPDEPLSHEKLSPVLALYRSDDFDSAIELCKRLTLYEGIGHTAGIYTNVKQRVETFAQVCPPSLSHRHSHVVVSHCCGSYLRAFQ